MSTRDTILTRFITDSGWAGATRTTVAGDASNRRYLRLSQGNETAILMDAPPDRGEDVGPFIAVAEHLRTLGLSAPRIMERDVEAGLLLIEDLGDDLFARVLKQHPEIENSLYSTAIDVLLVLHRHPPPDFLKPYSVAVMADLAALAAEWYAAGVQEPDGTLRDALRGAMARALSGLPDLNTVLIQRDYHAENLLWLPDRNGTARVGLLDFQDAMTGHPAYDLASLLQDARRDVPPATEAAMIDRYLTRAPTDPGTFRTAYAVLGAQRNLRILGVFARLCLRDGKAHYVNLIPRVWNLLLRDLAHPALTELRDIALTGLPEPDPATLQKLTAKCATHRQ